MSGRVHDPVIGKRYHIRSGHYTGFNGRVKTIDGNVKNNPPIILYLCDCWGGVTDREVVVRMSELEI